MEDASAFVHLSEGITAIKVIQDPRQVSSRGAAGYLTQANISE